METFAMPLVPAQVIIAARELCLPPKLRTLSRSTSKAGQCLLCFMILRYIKDHNPLK